MLAACAHALARCVETDPPRGLVLHCAGEVDGHWQIVDVWESEEQARRFDDERLRPAIERS